MSRGDAIHQHGTGAAFGSPLSIPGLACASRSAGERLPLPSIIKRHGSTAGRIQRNKGRFVEGYNVSIESAMLLQAYLGRVIKEAKLEFDSGTQDKKSLDQLFQ